MGINYFPSAFIALYLFRYVLNLCFIILKQRIDCRQSVKFIRLFLSGSANTHTSKATKLLCLCQLVNDNLLYSIWSVSRQRGKKSVGGFHSFLSISKSKTFSLQSWKKQNGRRGKGEMNDTIFQKLIFPSEYHVFG